VTPHFWFQAITTSRLALEPSQHPIHLVLTLKWLELETEHSPAFSSKVMSEWSHLCTHQVSSCCNA